MLLNFQRFFRWIKDFYCWVAEGKKVYVAIFVPICVFYPAIWLSPDYIRWSGWMLQLLGMLLAINGLLKVRSYFISETLYELFVNWLNRFPTGKGKTFTQTGNINLNLRVKAQQGLWSSDNVNLSIEERIERIIENINRIKEKQNKHANDIDDLKVSDEKIMKTVEEADKKVEESIESNLKSLHTDGFITSLAGLLWLTVGLTMSTMAQELFDIAN